VKACVKAGARPGKRFGSSLKLQPGETPLAEDRVLGKAIVWFCVSLGQMSEEFRTPAIVMFPAAEEVKLKLTALYIGACSMKGNMRTKQLKFSGYVLQTPGGLYSVPE
jgi:hypothetical protein